jgi:membrane-bound acyltransferase YfiQ involved in biofilm formation
LSFLPFAATFNLNKFKRVALNINQAPEQKV